MVLHPAGANQGSTAQSGTSLLLSAVGSQIKSFYSPAVTSSTQDEQPVIVEEAKKSQKLFAKILFFRARILLARKYVPNNRTVPLVETWTKPTFNFVVAGRFFIYSRRFQRASTFAERALLLDPTSA